MMFVIPKYMGGLCPICNIMQLNHYMYITKLKMPTVKQVWQLTEQYVFLSSWDDHLHISVVMHHCHYLHFAW